jgi:hypothetical protein
MSPCACISVNNRDGERCSSRLPSLSVQPEQPPRELPQVIPVCANGKPSRPKQSVGGLLF